MPSRKTNMLEAWKASHDAPSQAPQPAAPSAAPRPRPAPRARPPRLAGEPGPLALAIPERAPIFLALTLAELGLLALAFWLGRATASGPGTEAPVAGLAASPDSWSFPEGSASAPETAPASAPQAEEPEGAASPAAPALELDAEGRTADDRAFYDKSNRYTVRAIYYGNTPKGWKRALTAYRYLRGHGFPTVAPIDQGDIIVLCVGAAPERSGPLTELQERVRNLPGPPPASERGAFAGAYFVNIDDLVERR